MGDYTLSRDELVALGVVAFFVIIVPNWWAIFRNRRKARLSGYRPRGHGYSAGTVLLCLVPMTGVLFAWFLLSSGLLGLLHEHLPPKLMGGMPWMLFLLDLAALAISAHLCLPA